MFTQILGARNRKKSRQKTYAIFLVFELFCLGFHLKWKSKYADALEVSNENSKTLNEESSFLINELFVSTTNKTGIIESGNEVFYRVSEYTRDELLQQPHNKIRHPDMPKTAFRFMWDALTNNEPFCAYVKNRSKSGKYYCSSPPLPFLRWFKIYIKKSSKKSAIKGESILALS